MKIDCDVVPAQNTYVITMLPVAADSLGLLMEQLVKPGGKTYYPSAALADYQKLIRALRHIETDAGFCDCLTCEPEEAK